MGAAAAMRRVADDVTEATVPRSGRCPAEEDPEALADLLGEFRSRADAPADAT